ncbi:hypothetical protein BH24ACT5_BH24ACT5_07930 [soil metagenome]
MMPRIDLADLLMDVHAMTGCFDEFTHYALADQAVGTRMEDLAITLAAVFVAEGCNLGFTPVIKAGHPALTRNRLSHVDQNYVRAETLAAANARLIDAQSAIATAQIWGGGLVASVDGLRFVVPVRTLDAAPTPATSLTDAVSPGSTPSTIKSPASAPSWSPERSATHCTSLT